MPEEPTKRPRRHLPTERELKALILSEDRSTPPAESVQRQRFHEILDQGLIIFVERILAREISITPDQWREVKLPFAKFCPPGMRIASDADKKKLFSVIDTLAADWSDSLSGAAWNIRRDEKNIIITRKTPR